MLNPAEFHTWLKNAGVSMFAGVPDSLLKDFCAYVDDKCAANAHVITANEGAAVALAAGHHLATGGTALVYMQNSGLGNAVNPLTSLVDREVYAIPMLLLIGWRGEPGRPDEPQHIKQGRITPAMLDVLDIAHAVLPDDPAAAQEALQCAFAHLSKTSAPYALLVRAGTFEKYVGATAHTNDSADNTAMSRETALKAICDGLERSDVIVATTGKTSRELFEIRQASCPDHAGDFLTVGSMGHASQIALGIAMQKPDRQIICIDGDGAAIMHLGALAIIGSRAPANFKHVIINNGAHDSVGGQPTAGRHIDFCRIASACGYPSARNISVRDDVTTAIRTVRTEPGPALLEITARTGARSDLGRPTLTPLQNKDRFMQGLSNDDSSQ